MNNTQFRTQLFLDQDRYRWLKETATRQDASIAKVVRDLIDRVRKEQEKKKQKRLKVAHRALLKLIGKGKGGPPDVSENHDTYLGEDLYREMMAARPKTRS